MAFAGVDGAFILYEEVPSQNEGVYQISYYPTAHAEMTALDSEGDIDDADGVYFAAIDADGVTLERADYVVIQFGVIA